MENNKIITLVSNNYWTLFKFRSDVINNFINKGYRVNLIAKKDKYHKKFNNDKIQKFFIPLSERSLNIINEIRTLYSLYKIYSKNKSDLSFHFTIKPNIYASIITKIFGIKTISFITGIGHIFIKSPFLLKKIIIKLYQYSLKNSKEVWFTNIHDKKIFIENKIISSQKTRIVPGAGFNFTESPCNYKNTNEVKFLMVSRLQKEKGIVEFLQAARYFKNEDNISFTLVGDFNQKDPSCISPKDLSDYINDKSIIYYNYQANIKPLILESSCLIHPSYREGISTIIIEAAAHKRPIITTRVPGCIDIISNESFGILCEAKNTTSLINGIKVFLSKSSEDKINMTNKLYDFVKINFNRKDIIETYNSALEYIHH